MSKLTQLKNQHSYLMERLPEPTLKELDKKIREYNVPNVSVSEPWKENLLMIFIVAFGLFILMLAILIGGRHEKDWNGRIGNLKTNINETDHFTSPDCISYFL